ncbi:MAG: hypothetical protein AAGD32_15045 [Planctomycetota bacterium]
MPKSRIGGVVVALIGLFVIGLELTKPTIGGWLWLFVGGLAVILGTFNILGVGKSADPDDNGPE